MARMTPLQRGAAPELEDDFALLERTLGFLPKSMMTMARRPPLVRGLVALLRAVYDPKGEVDLGLKRLVGHTASMAAGCLYCRAHTATSAMRHGIAADKLAALPEYRSSPLYSEARAGRDRFRVRRRQPAQRGGRCYVRAPTRGYWTKGQIVEILGVVSLCGFFNRWNDSMATTPESEPSELAQTHLKPAGWHAGKHAPTS